MLDNILGKTITDKNFGDMKITKDKDSNIFTLTKTVDFGPHKKIDLYLENQDAKSTADQFKLFNLLCDNSSKIIKTCGDKYFDSYTKDLFEEFDLNFITINDQDTSWELWFTKKGSFENCVIEFDNVDFKRLSFQA